MWYKDGYGLYVAEEDVHDLVMPDDSKSYVGYADKLPVDREYSRLHKRATTSMPPSHVYFGC